MAPIETLHLLSTSISSGRVDVLRSLLSELGIQFGLPVCLNKLIYWYIDLLGACFMLVIECLNFCLEVFNMRDLET